MDTILRPILEFINSVVQNHGMSVIIFTILIRLVLMPLDIKSRKGMRKMTKLQPQINKLSVKYKDDKQKLQQKQAELFKKEHYNPLSGCLPLLIQWPVLIMMFGAMRVIANEQIVAQAFTYLTGQAPIQDSFLWIKSVWMPDTPFTSIAPDYATLSIVGADVWQRVFSALSPENLALVTANIPNYVDGMLNFSDATTTRASIEIIVNAMSQMPLYIEAAQPVAGWQNINLIITNLTLYVNYNGLLIMPALAGVSQVLMTKINPAAEGAAPAQNKQQGGAGGMANAMKYIFPVMSIVFCLTSNAGFAIYWVTSNIVSSVQGILITRYFDRKDAQAAALAGEGK